MVSKPKRGQQSTTTLLVTTALCWSQHLCRTTCSVWIHIWTVAIAKLKADCGWMSHTEQLSNVVLHLGQKCLENFTTTKHLSAPNQGLQHNKFCRLSCTSDIHHFISSNVAAARKCCIKHQKQRSHDNTYCADDPSASHRKIITLTETAAEWQIFALAVAFVLLSVWHIFLWVDSAEMSFQKYQTNQQIPARLSFFRLDWTRMQWTCSSVQRRTNSSSISFSADLQMLLSTCECAMCTAWESIGSPNMYRAHEICLLYAPIITQLCVTLCHDTAQ